MKTVVLTYILMIFSLIILVNLELHGRIPNDKVSGKKKKLLEHSNTKIQIKATYFFTRKPTNSRINTPQC